MEKLHKDCGARKSQKVCGIRKSQKVVVEAVDELLDISFAISDLIEHYGEGSKMRCVMLRARCEAVKKRLQSAGDGLVLVQTLAMVENKLTLLSDLEKHSDMVRSQIDRAQDMELLTDVQKLQKVLLQMKGGDKNQEG